MAGTSTCMKIYIYKSETKAAPAETQKHFPHFKDFLPRESNCVKSDDQSSDITAELRQFQKMELQQKQCLNKVPKITES